MKIHYLKKMAEIVSLFLFVPSILMAKVPKDLYSPDGKICIRFVLKAGQPYYEVVYQKKTLIQPSPLGFRLDEAPPLMENFSVTDTRSDSFDETWKPVLGEDKTIRNHYNQLIVTLRETSTLHRILILIFRAYDDGVAFRYSLPEQPNLKKFQIISEETRFNFAGNYTAWWIPADYDSYEKLYHETPLSKIKAVNTPVTMVTPDSIYLSIHEANLTDYAGMTLKRVKRSASNFECDLVPWPDGIKVKTRTPMKTPWRTIQIAARPGGLIESHLIVNLNEPCALKDVSWIKPMKYVGIWWGMHIGKWTWHEGPKHGATTARAKEYIDFASAHHIPALLVEGWNKGWATWWTKKPEFSFTEAYPDYNLNEVVQYGKEKGVVLIGHNETAGNVPSYDAQMEKAFALYEKLGIPAIKTGYAGKIIPKGQHHHGQWMVRHYRKVVKMAAKYHIMVDAHEPIKPTGIRRTYPNFLTREGVRGMEYNAWSAGNPPNHTTIVPFTRMLAGPLDYTPGIFNILFDKTGKHRVHTTLAKQLALYVILYSPLQMAADLVENYKDNPAFQFIEKVPSNWDETRVLKSRIGHFVTIVRRRGNEWFLGSITDKHPRLLEIPLDFLNPETRYVAHIYADARETNYFTNPTAVEIGQYQVTAKDTLPAALDGGGGMAVRFSPVRGKTEKSLQSIQYFRKEAGEKMKAFIRTSS